MPALQDAALYHDNGPLQQKNVIALSTKGFCGIGLCPPQPFERWNAGENPAILKQFVNHCG